MLAADASPMQEALQVTEYRMPQSAAALVGEGATGDTLATALPGLVPAAKAGSMTVTAQQAYSQLLGQLAGTNLANSTEARDFTGNWRRPARMTSTTLMTASPVRYASSGAAQVPRSCRRTRSCPTAKCSRRIRRCPCRMCTRT